MEVGRTKFTGARLLVLGSGSIAATALPLILRHIEVPPENVYVLSADRQHEDMCRTFGVSREHFWLSPDNFSSKLSVLVSAGDCVINLTAGICSRALATYCLANGVSYLDTSIETWSMTSDRNKSTSIFDTRKRLLAMQNVLPRRATAIVSHGANPGLVTHFAKRCIELSARADGVLGLETIEDEDWAKLAQHLGVQAVHICERDSQICRADNHDGWLVNTWSVDGLVEEAFDSACFAWGTHEPAPSQLGCRNGEDDHVIEIPGHAKDIRINSWLPSTGPFRGSVMPHEEAFSIAEMLSLSEDGRTTYRPTVLFAYEPSECARLSLRMCAKGISRYRRKVLTEDIVSGGDELGVLLLRKATRSVFWFGSNLEVREARRLVPVANATTLQVAAGVLGGLTWLLENDGRGLLEPEDLDYKRVLEVASPYLGDLYGTQGCWPSQCDSAWTFHELLLNEERVE